MGSRGQATREDGQCCPHPPLKPKSMVHHLSLNRGMGISNGGERGE